MLTTTLRKGGKVLETQLRASIDESDFKAAERSCWRSGRRQNSVSQQVPAGQKYSTPLLSSSRSGRQFSSLRTARNGAPDVKAFRE